MTTRIPTHKAGLLCLATILAGMTLAPSSLRAELECRRQVELNLLEQEQDEVRLSPTADRIAGLLVDSYLLHLKDPENTEYESLFVEPEQGTWYLGPFCAVVNSRSNRMFEIGIFLIGVPTKIGPRKLDYPPPLKLRITRQLPGTETVGQFLYDRSFREPWVGDLAGRDQIWGAEVRLDGHLLVAFLDRLWGHVDEDEARFKEEAYKVVDMISALELHFVARRVGNYCTMSASVSGDINQHFFGDVAYFNTSREYVKKGMMVGSMGETQTQEDVAGFGTVDVSEDEALSLAARLGFLSDEEAEEAAQDEETSEDHQEPEEEPQGFAAWAQQELRAEDGEEGDNFGLNLTDLKLDADPEREVEEFYTDDDNEGAMEFLGGNAAVGAMFAGAFTFTLSGRVDIAEFDVDPQQDEAPRMITVTPSTITASVGLSDKGGDRIPFEMREGSAVQGTIEISKENVDFIVGSLAVQLETKGVYTLEGVTSSPRKLEIQLVANFAARQGSLACGK